MAYNVAVLGLVSRLYCMFKTVLYNMIKLFKISETSAVEIS